MPKNVLSQDIIYQIHPLSPTNEETDIIPEYEIYKTYLDSAFNNSNVRNIAITGNFGIGKSSFLRYYAKAKKYLFVSGCSFFEQQNPDDDFVEYNLMYQLLLGCNRKKKSHREVCSFFQKALSFFTILFLFATVFLLSLAPKLGPYLRELGWYNKTGSNWIHAVVYIGFVFFLCIDALCLIAKGKRILKLKSISLELGGAKIEAEKAESESPLHKNRDALIQALVESSRKIDRTVIFEDMDRLDVPCCANLFTKLWELNKLVNLCLDNNKPIRFVYVIHDELFSLVSRKQDNNPPHQEKAEKSEPPVGIIVEGSKQETKQTVPDAYLQLKFFDYILPLIPKMSDRDAILVAKSLLNDNDLDDIITHLAPYLADYRLLRNIANEYNVFCRIYYERYKPRDEIKENQHKEEETAHTIISISSAWIYIKDRLPKAFRTQHQKQSTISTPDIKKTESTFNITAEVKKRILGFSIYKNLMPEDYKRIREGKSEVFHISEENANGNNLAESIKLLVEKGWVDDTCLHFVGYNRDALKDCISNAFSKGFDAAEQKLFWLDHELNLCCEQFRRSTKNSVNLNGVEFTFAAIALTEEGKTLLSVIESKSDNAPTEKQEDCSEDLLIKIHSGLGLDPEVAGLSNIDIFKRRQSVLCYLLLRNFSDLWKFVPGSNTKMSTDEAQWWELLRSIDNTAALRNIQKCCTDQNGENHLEKWAKSSQIFQSRVWRNEPTTDIIEKTFTQMRK